MARIKIINNVNEDLIGNNFSNTTSETVFSLGSFELQTNFTGRRFTNYSNQLSSFVNPITLDDLNLTTDESKNIYDYSKVVTLNFDRSDLKSFARFGSAAEIIRVGLEKIITNYPASLYVSTDVLESGNITFDNYVYDQITDKSTFTIPSAFISNKFSLVFDQGNSSKPNNEELKNLNISYAKYIIWRKDDSENYTYSIVGYTGDSSTVSYIRVECNGDPFGDQLSTSGSINFHIRPQVLQYNKFLSRLNDLEKYMLNDRVIDYTGFNIQMKNPIIGNEGDIKFVTKNFFWGTFDGYNPDINGALFNGFYDTITNLGANYDEIKSDLISRLLTPDSLKVYDTTEDGKVEKLLRLYGREFDQIKLFIDSLVYINKTTYDKKNNLPDAIVKNLAYTFGWDVFNLVKESDLLNAFFSTENEQNKYSLLPAEIDIELWRRILINTNYYWKSKGTRQAIKSMFLMIGIPEPFINITEYVYTVDGRIDPNTVTLSLEDIPSASLPYDSEGYPISPSETSDFFFQLSGNSDSGQAYIDVYRQLGFNVKRIVDNKKSWEEDGYTERTHYTTPNYFQNDSKLVINTKEVDVTLDLARGIEYDVFYYNQRIDDPLTSTGTSRPYLYVNVPFEYGLSANTFTIPETPFSGSAIQVNFNGVTLTSGSTGFGDYTRLDETTVMLNDEVAQSYSNGEKDAITLTYIFNRLGSTGYSQMNYLVTSPAINAGGTVLDLGVEPKGDIQLTVNGMTLTKGTSLFTGDFIIDPFDRTKIIIQNTELQLYLQSTPIVRVWYITDDGVSDAEKKSEAHRVDSFSSTKLFLQSPNFVYTMNYSAYDEEAIKVTLNGLTLQGGTDFTLNSLNKKQIKFRANTSIKYGDVIGVYYILGSGNTTPLLPADSTFPDIQDMTFLEYLELIQRRLINVTNRKTSGNFKGGYYPTVLQLYEEYLRRSFYDTSDPLLSNGYTFRNLYPFINQYNSFFSRFVNQLLPATIILKKGGILIRNTSFTRQKFTYRRGVNFDPTITYLGDDGAVYRRSLPTSDCVWDDVTVCQTENNLYVPTTTVPPTTTTSSTTTTVPPPTTSTTTTSTGTSTTTLSIDLFSKLTALSSPTPIAISPIWSVQYNSTPIVTHDLSAFSNYGIPQTDTESGAVPYQSDMGIIVSKSDNGGNIDNFTSIVFSKNGTEIFSTFRISGELGLQEYIFTGINGGDEIRVEITEDDRFVDFLDE